MLSSAIIWKFWKISLYEEFKGTRIRLAKRNQKLVYFTLLRTQFIQTDGSVMKRVTNFPIFCCVVNSSFRNRKNETEKTFILYFRSLVPKFYCVNGLFLILEIGTILCRTIHANDIEWHRLNKMKRRKKINEIVLTEEQQNTEEKNKANK